MRARRPRRLRDGQARGLQAGPPSVLASTPDTGQGCSFSGAAGEDQLLEPPRECGGGRGEGGCYPAAPSQQCTGGDEVSGFHTEEARGQGPAFHECAHRWGSPYLDEINPSTEGLSPSRLGLGLQGKWTEEGGGEDGKGEGMELPSTTRWYM